MWSDDIEAPLVDPPPWILGLRCEFIFRVYTILAVQILTTIAVMAGVAACPPVATFFHTTWGGWATYVAIFIVAITVLAFLYKFTIIDAQRAINFLLLAMFTLCISLLVGLAASLGSAPITLEAAIATVAVVVTLILYTFWVAIWGRDFGFSAPLSLSLIVTLMLFSAYLIYFPVEKMSYMIYNGLFVVIFTIYIIYEINKLIQRIESSNMYYIGGLSYDRYIWASVLLYLGVIQILRDIFLTIISTIWNFFSKMLVFE